MPSERPDGLPGDPPGRTAGHAPRSPGAAPHALVTGCSSGIGRAVALQLLAQGWRVSGAQRGATDIAHPAFTAIACDLADLDGPGAPGQPVGQGRQGLPRDTVGGGGLQRLLAQVGTPQAVVHAAGVLRPGALGQLRPEDGAQMWRLHVDAATRLADALLPRMAEAGHGRMVLLGSRVAGGMPGRSQYAASKAALVALARSWAAEVAPRGVTVNVVSPAATDTPMLADPARAASAPKLPPIGRLIRPEEVAALVAYLLGDAAAAITGQEIQICGGASLPR